MCSTRGARQNEVKTGSGNGRYASRGNKGVSGQQAGRQDWTETGNSVFEFIRFVRIQCLGTGRDTAGPQPPLAARW